MRTPPTHIPPPRLWRLLLQRPRPTWPLQFRLPQAPSTPLSARALTALEEASAASDVPGGLPPEVTRSRGVLALAALSLQTPSGKAFRDADEIAGCLDDHTVASLCSSVVVALDICSPSFARSDFTAWINALAEGASHNSNIGHAIHIATCIDISIGFGSSCRIGRPDRYFGMPMADLTDGQLMAFDAARTAADRLRPK